MNRAPKGAAGYIRNRKMAVHADKLISGAAHMIEEMRRVGKPLVVYVRNNAASGHTKKYRQIKE